MKSKNLILLLFAAIIALSSCSTKEESPLLDGKINVLKIKELATKMKSDPLISGREVKYLNYGLLNIKDSLSSYSVREMIDSGKYYEKLLMFKDFSMNVNQINMNNNLFSQVLSIDDEDSVYIVTVKFTNLSLKKIKTLSGFIRCWNKYGGQVSVPIHNYYVSLIPEKDYSSALRVAGTYKDQFDQLFVNELENNFAKCEFFIQAIVFDDDSRLSIEDLIN